MKNIKAFRYFGTKICLRDESYIEEGYGNRLNSDDTAY
jgi:hypothetical protein